jgi:VWFA-related protein
MNLTRWAFPALVLAAIAASADEPEKPRDLGLKESASTQLAQIDVTVSGPKDAIAGLTESDFEVRVNDKLLSKIFVDPLCRELEAPADVANAAGEESPVAPEPRAPVSYLLYFDMPHLTQMGRQSSIGAAREMLPKLMAGGNRAMLVSNAKELRTLVPMTTDTAQLDAALDKMTNDIRDFDPYAAQEENRLAEIVLAIQNRVDTATHLAREYAREERMRQERDLTRLRMTLGRLVELDAPKATLYFADTMRVNPGQHYLSFFSASVGRAEGGNPSPVGSEIALQADTGALTMDRVINEAAANGIRFYTIEGQGLTGPTSFIQAKGSASTMSAASGNSSNQASPMLNFQRVRDSQGTLQSMASETGGRSFLNGVSPAKMVGQIVADMSCVYLLSFDPRGFKQDAPLTVSVKVLRPKVKTTTRGRLVIQSESTRLTARVLSAYASPEARVTTMPVRVGVIPIGYRDGLFNARVQVAVPSSSVPGTTWDMGASLVSSGRVAEDGSGRITLPQAGIPAVWEKDMSFSPGEFEIVAVAHERTTDELASKEFRGAWPKLETELASFGPIAVSQATKGGFLRNGTTHTSGAVVAGEDDPLRADAPTAVVSLVCRAKDQKKPIRVVRTLVGENETPVGTTDLAMAGDERCAQILDLIPPKTLGPGSYRFVIAASSGGLELARAERKLFIPDPAPAPAVPPGAGSGR